MRVTQYRLSGSELEVDDEGYLVYHEDYAKLEAERDRLWEALKHAWAVADDTEEINPSNYDHDLVCQLNAGFCEIYGIIYSALQEGNDD